MRILRTSRNAADCPFSTIPKGLRIGCFSLQMWLSHFGAKDGQLQLPFNLFARSTIQIPANSQTQNLGLFFTCHTSQVQLERKMRDEDGGPPETAMALRRGGRLSR